MPGQPQTPGQKNPVVPWAQAERGLQLPSLAPKSPSASGSHPPLSRLFWQVAKNGKIPSLIGNV